MTDTLASELSDILVEEFNVPREKIGLDADLRNDLGLDSFEAVEIAFAIEEKFSIEIDTDAMPDLQTFKDLVEAVRRKVKG